MNIYEVSFLIITVSVVIIAICMVADFITKRVSLRNWNKMWKPDGELSKKMEEFANEAEEIFDEFDERFEKIARYTEVIAKKGEVRVNEDGSELTIIPKPEKVEDKVKFGDED